MTLPDITFLTQITSASDSEAVTRSKLVKGHAYSVTGADQVRSAGAQRSTLVRVYMQSFKKGQAFKYCVCLTPLCVAGGV